MSGKYENISLVIAITQHSSFPSKKRSHYRRWQIHVWLQNDVGMRATHHASLCSVWMGDDSWLDIYVNIYCFGESFPYSNFISAALTEQLLVQTGSLALYCHAELKISTCLPSLLQRKLIFCLAIWWSLPQANVFRSERVAWIIFPVVLQGKDED